MTVYFVPVGVKSFNGVLNLEDCMQALMKYARNHQTKPFEAFRRNNKNAACARCACGCGLEIHHLKPIWVYALEMILDHDLQTREDENNFRQECLQGFKSVIECHKPENLMYLCGKCHTDAQRVADDLWKNYFEKNCRVVFQMRNVAAIEKLLNR